jgi:polysaccharide biosynthesis transport protein
VELAEYLTVLRKYWLSIFLVVLAGAAAGGLVSLVMAPTYTATTSIFLSVQSGGSALELQQGSTYAENQVASFAVVASKPIVLEPVIQELGLRTTPDDLAKEVTAGAKTGTAIIEVAVTGRNAEQTAELANAVSKQLVSTVAELSPLGTKDTDAVKATIVAAAAVPTEPTSPKLFLNLVLGLLAGLLLGVGQAVLRDRMDIRVVGESDVTAVTDRSIVGLVPFDLDARDNPLVFQTDPHSSRAEAFRRVRTNLQFLNLKGAVRSLVITSSVSGEGKTTSAINVASALADSGELVLLIDADLRNPTIAKYLNLEGAAGLTTVVIGQASLAQVVQPVGSGNLHVLAAGQIPPNPSELLGSEAMQRLLDEAVGRYDTVIVDSPPLLPVTDAAILSTATGGALFVVGSGSVTRPELASALASLDAVDANVLGLVMNKLPTKGAHYHRYQRYSYYHRQDDSTAEPGLEIKNDVLRVGKRSTPVTPQELIHD